MFAYIERTTQLADVLVSGGDGYSLTPTQLLLIGQRLLAIPHIQRIRFASKGLAICPSRFIDPMDSWVDAIIQLSNEGRAAGKGVSLHTHFNHPSEITWITEAAARRLFRAGVQVRNQSVLLNGINSDVNVMSTLIRRLAALNIQLVSAFSSLALSPRGMYQDTDIGSTSLGGLDAFLLFLPKLIVKDTNPSAAVLRLTGRHGKRCGGSAHAALVHP